MFTNISYYTQKIIFFFSILIISLCLFALSGCSSKEKSISKSAVFFDTYITISIFGSDDASTLDECMTICGDFENMLSATVPESDIYKINHSNGQFVAVNYETLKLIEDSIYYSTISDGMFDITVYTDYALWDFHAPGNPLPDNNDIQESIKHINYRNIVTDKNTCSVKLLDPDTQIELGGIAKGYIADKLGEHLLSQGITSAIINIGGDIKTIGSKPGNKPYTIGIQDPNEQSGIITTLSISDLSVTTSGIYERYILSEGMKYHHILDPQTGYPVNTDVKSVTVISKNAETADALCTSVILLGKDAALPLIESTNDAECIIVTTDDNEYLSSGMQNYIIR